MIRHDLRFAVRSLASRPGFAAVCIVTLALGIGANTAIFSVVNAVLLRPLPYPGAERVVRIRGWEPRTAEFDNLSPLDFLDVHDRVQRFTAVAAFNNFADRTVTGLGEAERVSCTRVTSDFFSVLGVPPMLGRDFRPDDDVPGARPTVIVSNGYWQRRFGSDPGVVGRTVQLSGVATDVIGVLPARFEHPLPRNLRQPDIYVPFQINRAEESRSGRYLQALGRLKPGVSIDDGRADLAGIAADLERAYPQSNTGQSLTVVPLIDAMVGSTRPALYVLLASVALVLLIACANVANLLLARSSSRRKEIAVRQALGAGRWQLVRQLLVEHTALSAAGGVCGVVLAAGAVRVLAVLGANRIPRGSSIALDGRVLLFALAVSVATALLFGIGPALAATRAQPQNALHIGGRSGGSMRQRTQQLLVGAETALALMLLVGAGLLAKSLWRLDNVDPGFAADHVLTFRTSLPIARYPEGTEIPFYQQFEQRLSPLPGVRTVGAVNILPLTTDYSCNGFSIVGRPPDPPGQGPCAEARSITPGYFEALGIPLMRGRGFTAQDTERSAPVTIISDDMARKFWPNQDAIGAQITHNKTTTTIVGIVAGVKHFGLDKDAPFEMYTPHAQQPSYHSMIVVLRTSADAAALIPAIRRELSAMDENVPISDVETMRALVAESTTEPRFRTVVVSGFAALAVLLAVVGVAGVTAYAVTRRTPEIGVRVALGATRGSVVRLMLVQGFAPTAAGLAAGLGGAFILTRLLSGLLFGVAPIDAGIFASATAVLACAALAATYVPARRAAAVDPMITLRAD